MDKNEKEIHWSYLGIGGNLIINPKSTTEDQIFELVNNYYNENNEPPMKRCAFEKNEIIIKE